MAISNGIKIGVLVAALGATAFFTWRNLNQKVDGDDTFTTAIQYYKCSANHEFEMTAEKARATARENNGMVLCPTCKAISTDMYKCSKCSKFLELVGHGQLPKVCPHCKQPPGA
ncbi:MAG TPA: hypothetical protein VK176_05400 [Phycisphaerales bacterium]|nr:hypothetical protein [Phycisphaerales bacterium]